MVLTSIINLKLDTLILRLILKYKTNEFLMILTNITTWIAIKNYGLISKLKQNGKEISRSFLDRFFN